MINRASGENAVFNNGLNVPFDELKINISPYQIGTGRTSPSNVKQLFYFNRARVSVTRENIFDYKTLVRRRGYSTPQYEFINNGIRMKYNGGSSYIGMLAPLMLIKGKLYKFTAHVVINSINGDSARFCLRYISSNNIVSNAYSIFGMVGEYDAEFSWLCTGTPVYLALLGNFSNGGSFDIEFTDIFISSENNIENKKYFGKNYEIDFSDKPTVYGGVLDVISGKLSSTFKLLELDGVSDGKRVIVKEGINTANIYGIAASDVKFVKNGNIVANVVSTHFETDSHSNMIAGNSEYSVGVTVRSATPLRLCFPLVEEFNSVAKVNNWLQEQYTNGTPVQIAYESNETTVYNVDKKEVVSLFGYNYVVAKAYSLTTTGTITNFINYNKGIVDVSWKASDRVDDNCDYISLITSEFEKSKKFNSFVKTFLDVVSLTVNILRNFDLIFSIDNAYGNRLDMIGSLIGIGRELPIDDSDIPSILSDQTYRLVLKAKILKNHWDGTYEGLMKIINYLFPNVPIGIIDNQDMSYSIVIISTEIDDEISSLISNGYIFPKPAGVKVNYLIYESVAFGWDSDTELIKGWDLGTWGKS